MAPDEDTAAASSSKHTVVTIVSPDSDSHSQWNFDYAYLDKKFI